MLNNDFALKQKEILQGCISDMDKDREKYVKNPGVDFTRNRKLSFAITLICVLSMVGKNLNEAIHRFFSANNLEFPTKVKPSDFNFRSLKAKRALN